MAGLELLSGVVGHITQDPKVQAVVLGFVVKMAVDWLKQLFTKLDEQGTKVYAVPVQALVGICSMLATLGDLYLHSQLSTFDPQTLVNFVTTTIPVYLSAVGIHLIHTDVKKTAEEKKNGS